MKKRSDMKDIERLADIVIRFGMAMQSAHFPAIAEHERMTPNMEQIWREYVAFCQERVGK